ncbi:MAG: GntR family transcriptional regulator [Lentisphaeria bacterium]|nr:GntR family transcriptional regulator [Lentisphaeria bacterium]
MEKKSNRKNNSLPRDIILQELRSRIESSLPGTRLPSENALAIKFNTARMTVTRVFRQLEEEGLIERRKGCGSFVKGMRTVTFFLPYPEFIIEQGYMAEIFRARLHGAIRASQDMRLKLNIFPVLRERGAFYSPQVFQDFSPANLVVTSSIIPECFQFLFEYKIRTVLFDDMDIPHGIKQYTYDWITLEKDHASAIEDAAEKLRSGGCANICAVNFNGAGDVFASADLSGVSVLSAPKGVSPAEERMFLAESYRKHRFDGLILSSGNPLSENSLNGSSGLPEDVKVIGVDMPAGKTASGSRCAFLRAPDDVMGYDAVKFLAAAPRMGVRKKYGYVFENIEK